MNLKNTCIICQETWKEGHEHNEPTLDNTDHFNLEEHGELYSVCGDCSAYGEPFSIHKF